MQFIYFKVYKDLSNVVKKTPVSLRPIHTFKCPLWCARPLSGCIRGDFGWWWHHVHTLYSTAVSFVKCFTEGVSFGAPKRLNMPLLQIFMPFCLACIIEDLTLYFLLVRLLNVWGITRGQWSSAEHKHIHINLNYQTFSQNCQKKTKTVVWHDAWNTRVLLSK